MPRRLALTQLDRLENWQTDPFAHGWLIFQKIRQVHAFEHVVDLLLQHHPDWTDAAVMRRRASRFLNWVADAMQVEGLQFGGVDHVADGYLIRRSREQIAAAGAAHTLDHVSATKSQKDLLDVIGRQSFLRSYVASCNRAILRPARQVQGADYAILGPRGNPHPWRIPA